MIAFFLLSATCHGICSDGLTTLNSGKRALKYNLNQTRYQGAHQDWFLYLWIVRYLIPHPPHQLELERMCTVQYSTRSTVECSLISIYRVTALDSLWKKNTFKRFLLGENSLVSQILAIPWIQHEIPFVDCFWDKTLHGYSIIPPLNKGVQKILNEFCYLKSFSAPQPTTEPSLSFEEQRRGPFESTARLKYCLGQVEKAWCRDKLFAKEQKDVQQR